MSPRRSETNPAGDIDSVLLKDLLNLSLKDRNAIDEEIHGVTNVAPKESPEFLKRALWELSSELAAIPDDDPIKAAYTESQIIPETYVNTPNFRLRFLRCELFDAKRAAARMVRFLDHGLDLFGPEILQRPIEIRDLTEADRKRMLKGFFQILPYRDRTGRPIYAWVGGFDPNKEEHLSNHRIGFYQHYIMSEDVESQQKGCTKVMWAGSNNAPQGLPGFANEHTRKFFAAVPIRNSAIHWCMPDAPRFKLLRTAYGLVHKQQARVRLKFHYGTDVELQYTLKTFGIPVETIPANPFGIIETAYLKQWMNARELVENQLTNEKVIVVFPGLNDVLFRRGSTLLSHPGNSRFENLIESRMREHSNASRGEKITITKSIISTIQGKEGRFLVWNSKAGGWDEIEDESQIYTKVANKVKLFKLKAKSTVPQKVRSGTFLFQNQDNRAKRRKIFPGDSSSDEFDNNNNGCDCACLF